MVSLLTHICITRPQLVKQNCAPEVKNHYMLLISLLLLIHAIIPLLFYIISVSKRDPWMFHGKQHSIGLLCYWSSMWHWETRLFGGTPDFYHYHDSVIHHQLPMSGIDQQENMGYVSHEATLTNMDWIKTQYGLVITSIIKCGLKLCIHS